MCNDNGKPFIATLYNVLFSPDFYDQLFSIITLMNQVHTCFFHKGFCKVLLSDNEHNAVTLLLSAQQKHSFLVKKRRKSQNHKRKFPKRKFIQNYCIRYQDTGLQGRYWMEILQMVCNTLGSGQILTLYAYRVRYTN